MDRLGLGNFWDEANEGRVPIFGNFSRAEDINDARVDGVPYGVP